MAKFDAPYCQAPKEEAIAKNDCWQLNIVRFCVQVSISSANLASGTESLVCVQALQLRQAQKQYREARTRLQQDLRDTESALLRGIMPNTLLALQPAMQPSLHAPSMAGAGSQVRTGAS